jgi:ribosome maturation factor RimP
LRRAELLDRLRGVVSPVLTNLGYDLVELTVVVSHGRRTLRVFIDKEGGVTLQDCARSSKAIGFVLDDGDLFPGRYYLEVSSPGAERKLRTREDFKRFVGRKAHVRFREDAGGVQDITGEIKDFRDDILMLQPEGAEPVAIRYVAICGANLSL